MIIYTNILIYTNKHFNDYKKDGYKAEDNVRLEVFRIECQQAVEDSKSWQ